MIALVLVAGAVYWFKCRDRDASAVEQPTAREPSLSDKLKSRPKRTRWAAPLCKPTGVVKLPDGKPAGNATVMLQAAPLSHRVTAEPSDEPDAQTAADGRFELTAIAAGTWTLIAAVPGHQAVVRELVVQDARDCANLDLTLGAPGQSVSGFVLDVSGGPIKGALVVARPPGSAHGNASALAASRADGSYEFAVAPGDYTIGVRHPQYVGVEGQVAVRGPTKFDAVLTPGAEVRGKVLTRDRREPVAGARVTLTGGRASGAMGGLEREAVTADDGTFSLTALGSGRAWINAVGPNHASRDPVEIAIGIAETRDDVEVLVDPARRIRGLVMHEGKPTPNAIVSAYLGGGDQVAEGEFEMDMLGAGQDLSAETDADGVFELWGLAPGVYGVTATGPHALPAPAVDADVTKGDVDALELVLGHGVTIRGRVEPPQVATVSLSGMAMAEASERWISASEVKTDANGRFELHGTEAGDVTLYAYSGEGFTGEKQVTVAATGADDVVIPMTKSGVSVSGRVVDTKGHAVVGVLVGVWGVVTAADGTFKVPSTEPGQYSLSISDSEDTLQIITPKLTDDTLEIPAGGIADLQITVEPRDKIMRGVVIGADGKPSPDTWVVAVASWDIGGDADGEEAGEGGEAEPMDLSSPNFDWTGRKHIALTNADGQFAIGGLKAGVYDVAAEGDRGNARGVTRNASPDRPVRVQLTTLAGLTVTATRAGGAPVTSYQLELNGPEPDSRVVKSPEGRITLRGLPPGEYTVRAVADDGVATSTIQIAQGASANATLALAGFASVTGQVVDKTAGTPIANAYVYVSDALPDPDPNATWQTDANGRFSFKRLPAGEHTVQVFGGAEPVEVKFTVTAGQRADVGVIRIVPAPEPPPIQIDPMGSSDDPDEHDHGSGG